MSTNLERLKELLNTLEPEMKGIQEASAELQKRKEAIFDAIGDLSESFEDEDEDDLREELDNIAYNFDVTWNGNYEYGDWGVGERVEFWVPSTC